MAENASDLFDQGCDAAKAEDYTVYAPKNDYIHFNFKEGEQVKADEYLFWEEIAVSAAAVS
jgi:hypothetical protein